MEKKNIKLLYLGLHNQLVKTYGYNTITRKVLWRRFGMHYYIPKPLRDSVLKEMEEMNLIKKVNRDNIEILDLGIDIEEDYHKLNKIIKN